MTGIEDAKNTATEFLKRALGVQDVKVIGATKVDNEWHIEAEVYEENSFLKTLGLPTRVQDRNIYDVKLSDDLEIESYERQGHTLTTG
ncbi:MAG: gas vesicle protein [Sedimentisphaerales bacterium]|jgi:alcohol dehydrogenase YqhD (iron-dependent ADH family)